MIRHTRLTLALAVGLTGCGVKINGKSYGLGGGSAAASPDASSSSASDERKPSSSGDSPDSIYYKAEPYPKAPADPWAAISGDQPIRLDEESAKHITARGTPGDCTAAHDHCLPRNVWFAESARDLERDPVHRTAATYLFGPADNQYELTKPWNAGKGNWIDTSAAFTAYRTVPVTRKNLRKGLLVASMGYPAHTPGTGEDVWNTFWYFGVVDRIDWDSGKLYYVANTEPHWIASARVAVLAWKPGGKVEILNGAKRDQLAVAAADTIAPPKVVAAIADPWSQVGADKKPKIDPDDVPLESVESVECDAAHDHCLRPWVWFVESSGVARPGRYTKAGFVYADDGKNVIDNAGMAYRTVPATAANLHPGATVVVFPNTKPNHEVDALSEKWIIGKVAEVQPEAGLVKLADDDRYTPLNRVRVAIVQWFPGEKAEKVP